VFSRFIGIFAAVFGPAWVVKYRLKYGQGMGIAEDLDLRPRVRAHGNLVEYAPLTPDNAG